MILSQKLKDKITFFPLETVVSEDLPGSLDDVNSSIIDKATEVA
jgi:hypothetical protein